MLNEIYLIEQGINFFSLFFIHSLKWMRISNIEINYSCRIFKYIIFNIIIDSFNIIDVLALFNFQCYIDSFYFMLFKDKMYFKTTLFSNNSFK